MRAILRPYTTTTTTTMLLLFLLSALLASVCSVSGQPVELAPNIVNGTRVPSAATYPWFAALFTGRRWAGCGG